MLTFPSWTLNIAMDWQNGAGNEAGSQVVCQTAGWNFKRYFEARNIHSLLYRLTNPSSLHLPAGFNKPAAEKRRQTDSVRS